MLTIFSGIFGFLRWINAFPSAYFFFASLGLLVCLAQMVSGKVPRGASTTTGAIFIPVWFLGYAFFSGQGGRGWGMVGIGIPCLAVGGAFVGYAAGTLAAGCFLATDLLESAILRHRGLTPVTPPHAGKTNSKVGPFDTTDEADIIEADIIEAEIVADEPPADEQNSQRE
jgi:hypothetical protein